jgi:hypothetical protein
VIQQRIEVGDLLPPTYRVVPRDRRPPAAALVVIMKGATLSQRVELRKEIIVMSARAAVENDDLGS